jgi:hypothetical protein
LEANFVEKLSVRPASHENLGLWGVDAKERLEASDDAKEYRRLKDAAAKARTPNIEHGKREKNEQF